MDETPRPSRGSGAEPDHPTPPGLEKAPRIFVEVVRPIWHLVLAFIAGTVLTIFLIGPLVGHLLLMLGVPRDHLGDLLPMVMFAVILVLFMAITRFTHRRRRQIALKDPAGYAAYKGRREILVGAVALLLAGSFTWVLLAGDESPPSGAWAGAGMFLAYGLGSISSGINRLRRNGKN